MFPNTKRAKQNLTKMSFQGISYTFVGIVILLTGSAATVKSSAKSHHSQHGPAVHHNLVNESQHPHVEVSLLDYKGDPIKNLSRHLGSYVVLPYLNVEDYIWEGFSIQLKCTYNTPVEWVYHGVGVSGFSQEIPLLFIIC